MPLELNGQPYKMTDDERRKYSKTYIFRCGKQFIRQNRDPEMPQFDIAPVHVPTSYNHYEMDSQGVRNPMGVLRYYEAKNTVFENGRSQDIYTPMYIGLTTKGYMKCDDPERSFFLDNCPWNEKVHGNSKHPNWKIDAQTLISTYDNTDRSVKMLEDAELLHKVTGMLLERVDGKYKYKDAKLKAIAAVIVQEAVGRAINHKLYDYEQMTDTVIRAELTRIAQTRANDLFEIMTNLEVDYMYSIREWKKLKVIEYNAKEMQWLFVDGSGKMIPIVNVVVDENAEESLVRYFKLDDKFGKMFKRIGDKAKEVEQKLKQQVPA